MMPDRHGLGFPTGDQIRYPEITPVPPETRRPFWSVMIPTYNRTKYLAKTLRSILDQAPGPEEMQIEVIDNCSTEGDAGAMVAEIGKGRVSFCRQAQNVGVTGNFNTCVERARGHWVHIMHDDDMVMPGFYAAYRALIEAHPEVVMVYGRAIAINEDDDWLRIMYGPPKTTVLTDGLRDIVAGDSVVCPTAVVSRKAYEVVGGYAPSLRCAPDWEMWIRLAALGSIGYIAPPHLLYRFHAGSGTNNLVADGVMMQESMTVLEIGLKRLPPELRRATRKKALRWYAAGAGNFGYLLEREGRYRAALRNALWAVRLRPSARHLYRLMRCAARGVFHACAKATGEAARRGSSSNP